MISKAVPRLLVLALIFAMATPPAFAGREAAKLRREGRGTAVLVWEVLARLFPIAGKSSGTMDPNGNPAPELSGTTEGDAHGTMDPDGRP